MFLAIDWPDMLAMTGIGFGVVFCILLLLVFVLKIFSAVGAKSAKSAAPAKAAAAPAAKIAAAPAADDDFAAVATALYLYFQEVHDEESFKLTIHHHAHTAWCPEND